jgi:arylsulfatase A-like enzyme
VPGVKPRVVDAPFSGVDLAPTIMNLFQRGAPNRFNGISFLPLMTGKENSVDRDYIINICFLHDSYAVIEGNRWKLIYNRDHAYYMLYDLKEDPRETRSVADQYPERCAEMIKALERFLWEGRDTYANPKHYE